MAEIFLVTGGARSGKSSFAEKLTLKLGGEKVAYIATAQIFDEEMAHRVKLHKARRGKNWITFESPFNADKSITLAAKNFDAILFDCVTIYLSNFLCAEDLSDSEKIYKNFSELMQKLIDAAKNSPAKIIFVSNEVGAGIVPENKLARIFRDLSGLANQKIAAEAEKIFLTVAGYAVDVKKLGEKI